LLNRYRRKSRPGSHGDAEAEAGSERLTDTIAFVGGAYGILLGLLLVFAVGHFVDARQVSKDEAATAAALFAAVDPFPVTVRDTLRHDLLCYMSSAATDDWAAMRAGDLTGSENTGAYASRVQKEIAALPQDKDVEASNHYFVTEEILDLAKDRQPRLLHAVPEIPPVNLVGALRIGIPVHGLTIVHPRPAAVADATGGGGDNPAAMAIIGALIQLDAPYVGIGTSLRPVALDAAMDGCQDAITPASLWAPCKRLAAEEAGRLAQMTYVVSFDDVSTVGLESSPVAAALAGLRANESALLQANKYNHNFT
jgi:hypothetical protein